MRDHRSEYDVECKVEPAAKGQIEQLVLLMRELGYQTSHDTMKSQYKRYANSKDATILVAFVGEDLCGVISGHLCCLLGRLSLTL